MSNTQNPEIFSRANQDAKIFDLEQFTFWAEPTERGAKRPRLVFSERNGAPRITVFTGQDAAKVFWVGFGPIEFMMFLAEFERLAMSEGNKAGYIENLDRDPNSDKRDPNPAKVIRNKLWFGKDENGICYLGFEQRNMKNIRFSMAPNGWHNFYREGGAKLTEAEASVIYTRGMINIMRQVFGRWASRLRLPLENQQKQVESSQAVKEGGMASLTTFDNDIQF